MCSMNGMPYPEEAFTSVSAQPRHPTTDPGFERLLAAARTGDRDAWREIYDALAPAVLGYVRARGASDPEDLTGEVFVQVVRDLASFEGDAAGFRAWVFTIAHHRLLDQRRRETRRPQSVGEPLEEVQVHGGDVEAEALERISFRRVTELLRSLSPDQRDVLLLRIVGDLSLEEVARVTGKRTGAVKQLQRRGLAAIRRQLQREVQREGVTESAGTATS
jgi:RNA polymerase sigma factor (sigma-70 family)